MNKEACILIVDAHHTMNKTFGGKDQSRFELAIESASLLVQQKVSYAI